MLGVVVGTALLWLAFSHVVIRQLEPGRQFWARLAALAAFAMGTWLYLLRLHLRVAQHTEHVHASTKSTREYLLGFFDQLPMGALILDATGRVLHCNRRAVDMIHLPEATIRETDWRDPGFAVINSDGHPLPVESLPVNQAMATRQPVREAIMGLELPDGDWAWVACTAEPRLDPEGALKDIVLLFEDVTHRRTVEAELALQTFRDRLTGLPNRTLFMERLSQALLRLGRRKGTSTGVLFLDLDRFKKVNDSLSHEAGDLLLGQVARRIRQCMRPEDTVARLGGDEFVVLFEDLQGTEGAMRIADRIAASFQEAFLVEQQEVFTTCSMGLALAGSAECIPSELVRDAEVAMYRAKAKGEGVMEIFDPSMNQQALYRLQMEAELRKALERSEFLLHYQPVVGLESGAIEGWEALVRWRHPERGMVSPLDFITLAEETGLIVPLGKWVLEEACRQAALWHRQYPCDPPRLMNVNISGRQFQARDLIDTVTSALDAHNFPPRNLKLEITESVMMRDPHASLEAMKVFRSLNIHLVVDDFGTGYSSLSYLRRFPVDTLKVDKSFVDGLGKDAEATAIVQAVIGLARALGMRVVAEGIETPSQLALLRELGCDQGQGYHFSRPLDAVAAEALLVRDPRW